MPEFLILLPPKAAIELFLSKVTMRLGSERVPTGSARGRILAEPIVAVEALPAFARSAVDGYAVRSVDTHGANESAPAYLAIVGEIAMGRATDGALGVGECMAIHTGGMIPRQADAVLMLEHTQRINELELECYRAVANGENLLLAGEDVKSGDEVIPKGTRLGPAEIGGLMALGVLELPVRARPRVGILSTGDELVESESYALPGQVRDVNSHSLSALVEDLGGLAKQFGIVGDELTALTRAARTGLDECDVLVITAGSSASVRDLTAQVINDLGKPGVLVHGLNVRPGKPTLLGVCDGKPVIGLPGNPVSALVIGMIVLPELFDLVMEAVPTLMVELEARLRGNLPSAAGREDFIPVTLTWGKDGWSAEPVFGKSNLIFTLVRADGLVHIPAHVTGLSPGDTVRVRLLAR